MQAWGYWWQGCHLDEHLRMWGLHMLWWARIGKFLQCVAAVTVVAEIIGPARLRTFGNSLHEQLTIAGIRKAVSDIMQWGRIRFPKWDKYSIRRSVVYTLMTMVILFIPLSIICGILLTGFSDVPALLMTALMVNVVVVVFSRLLYAVVHGAIVGAMVAALAGGAVIDVIIVEPIAWVLDRPALDRTAKICALLLFIIGFHFDFLTS
jgi:hypothetical protein